MSTYETPLILFTVLSQLSIGIVASMFTAIVVTRVIFDYFVLTRKVGRLSI